MNKNKMTVDLIKRCEGFKSKAYKDSLTGTITIGIGIARKYPNGNIIGTEDTCTLEKAYEYLNEYLKNSVFPIIDELQKKYHFNDHVYAALCSLYYNQNNIGPALEKALSTNDHQLIADAFYLYDKYHDPVTKKIEVSTALKNRRYIEIDYFIRT